MCSFALHAVAELQSLRLAARDSSVPDTLTPEEYNIREFEELVALEVSWGYQTPPWQLLYLAAATVAALLLAR